MFLSFTLDKLIKNTCSQQKIPDTTAGPDRETPEESEGPLDPLFEGWLAWPEPNRSFSAHKTTRSSTSCNKTASQTRVEVPQPEASIPFPEDLSIQEEAGDSQAWEEPLTGDRDWDLVTPRETEKGSSRSAAGCPATAPAGKDGRQWTS